MNRYHAIDDNYLSVYDIETLASQEDEESRVINEVTAEDISDLHTCGVVAKYWHWRKLFFAIKSAILETHGKFDGYDMQVWDDMGTSECGDSGRDDVLATHKHILKRYIVLDSLFHCPTNEFYYFNFDYQTEKYSNGYFELVKDCKIKIDGKRQPTWNKAQREVGWWALKRLVRRHGSLLR